MIDALAHFERAAVWLFWVALALAGVALGAVIIERLSYGWASLRSDRIRRGYQPLIDRALAGDEAAGLELAASPARHRLALAWLLIQPLIDDRDPTRIAGTRRLADAISLGSIAPQLLHSTLWWRRARALRAIGLLQYAEYSSALVAALDDPHPDVRGAALDALSDLKDPRSLPAIIARMHDVSLYRGRRAQALAAFGGLCESFVLDLGRLDHENRLNYALVLARVGTARARPALCGWATDARAPVRTAVFEALARVGLDEEAMPLCIDALRRDEMPIRAMAARALRHWATPDAAVELGHHLDDEWPVALQAAQSLRAMNDAGIVVLQTQAPRTDLAGRLARQMLWEAGMPC
jgi:hypothetical protein